MTEPAGLTMVQALNAALARAMAEDARVLVLGEDVGIDGGVFRVTDGLLDRFGADRVRDTPLAETVIAGLSVGVAAQGFRPVAEIQLRDGSDLTLVTWGAMTVETLAAADQLAAMGVSSDVLDVATLSPLDMTTILRSVEKTGRCVIVHEAALTGGFGAEIAARLAEHGLLSLQAPVKRVTGYDTVMPLPRLEHIYMPSTERVLAAARDVLAFS